MLLIFDLDDTLIPTTAHIAPIRLERALLKMERAGLILDDFENLRKEVRLYNERAIGTEAVLREFCSRLNGEAFLEIGLKELNETPLGEISIPLNREINLHLEDLSQKHSLAIVTKGNQSFQEEKIDLFDLRRHFGQIVVAKDEKKSHYAAISKERSPLEVLVVGDRIEADLRGAKELGFYTVQMQQGRGKEIGGDLSIVDFCVEQFEQLIPILKQLEERERV